MRRPIFSAFREWWPSPAPVAIAEQRRQAASNERGATHPRLDTSTSRQMKLHPKQQELARIDRPVVAKDRGLVRHKSPEGQRRRVCRAEMPYRTAIPLNLFGSNSPRLE